MGIKIRYRLSEAAQRAAILAGADARRDREAEIATTPERLAVAQVAPDGTASIGEAVPKPGNAWGWIEVDTPDADPGAALDARLAQVADAKAKIAAQVAAEHAVYLAELAASLAYVTGPGAELRVGPKWSSRIGEGGLVLRGYGRELPTPPLRLDDQARDQLGIVRAWLALVWKRDEADAQEREAREKAETAKAERLKEEAARRAAAERDAWIAAHGSERLKKCRALGIADRCQGVYLDERLAHEAPGYVWDGEGDHAYKESTIRNPSIEALAELERARETWPGAGLVKIKIPLTPSQVFEEDLPEGWEWKEAIRIDAPEDLPWVSGHRIAYRVVQP
jgi:hypothetical protein